MKASTWQEAIDRVEPYIVKISTPRGSGTGFLCAHARKKGLCGIATAAHVLSPSHQWEEPIRIHHYKSGKTVLLRAAERVIRLDEKRDTAAVIFMKEDLPLPESSMPLIREAHHLRIGIEIGWVGFPAVSPGDLCFFTGRVSSWLRTLETYLVDGVAINGVSGGPAFWLAKGGLVRILGVVSAYLPNRAAGDTLPGLSMITSVEQFQTLIKDFESFDEAKEQETPPSEVKDTPPTCEKEPPPPGK